MRSRLVLAAAALTTLGCDTPGGPAVATVSRDSAGITIVENSRPDLSLDYVLALWKDEVDLEYVRLYQLEKPPTT